MILQGGVPILFESLKQGAGKVSRKDADTKALAEFQKYRVEQDRAYISDFDRSTKAVLETKPKKKGKPKLR